MFYTVLKTFVTFFQALQSGVKTICTVLFLEEGSLEINESRQMTEDAINLFNQYCHHFFPVINISCPKQFTDILHMPRSIHRMTWI